MFFILTLSAALFSVNNARLTCPQSAKKTIRIDGILNEWDALTPLYLEKGDIVKGNDKIKRKTDFASEVKCSYVKGEGLYFMVDVTDSRIVRYKRLSRKHDHLVMAFNKKKYKIKVFPPKHKNKGKVVGKTRGIKVKVVKRRLGYAVEVGIPWGKFKLYDGMPVMPFNLTIYDTDSAVKAKPETIASLDKKQYPEMTRIDFGGPKRLYQSALAKLGLSEYNVKKSKFGNFVGGKKIERLVLADKFLIVIGGDVGKSFIYTSLAVTESGLKKFKLLDLNNDKKPEVLTEFSGDAGTATWKGMAVWKITKKGIKRIFSHFIEFRNGKHFLVNKYTIRRRRGSKMYLAKFSFDKASKTITKKNWQGSEGDNNIIDFIFPWSSKKSQIYYFNNKGYSKK
ncbi:MAG: hypothetical protein ACQES9_02040 [Myxococcota bacterium]